jgi:hypothetical protein
MSTTATIIQGAQSTEKPEIGKHEYWIEKMEILKYAETCNQQCVVLERQPTVAKNKRRDDQ